MKTNLLSMVFVMMAIGAHAHNGNLAMMQDADKDTLEGWKFGGFTSFQVNQMALVNWVAGGENSFSGIALATLHARYRKKGWRWETALDLGYGLMYSERFDWQKTEDKINLTTKVTHAIGRSKSFNYAAEANFRTQFAPGYILPNDSVVVSRFMAPGYLVATLGIEYKPKEWIQFYLSPITGKMTFVMDQVLADAGNFGVTAATYDEVTGAKLTDGANVNPEFGAMFRMRLTKEIMKNITLGTDLTLFNNYSDKDPVNRRQVDVNWETSVSMKVNKLITVSLFTHLIWDYDIKQDVFHSDGTPVYQLTENGTFVLDGDGNRVQKRDALVQFKEVLGVGISYKF